MAQRNRTILKSYFETGDKPTESQFEDLVDSCVNHSDDSASTTQKGIVQKATLSEVNIGSENTKYVTPEGAKHAVETHSPIISVNGQTGVVQTDVDTGWIQATLQSGFMNYGGNYAEARYRKKNGVLYIEGLINGGAVGSVIFNLPVGFRPSETLVFPVVANYNLRRIDVNSNGDVLAVTHDAVWMSLSGISFFAD